MTSCRFFTSSFSNLPVPLKLGQCSRVWHQWQWSQIKTACLPPSPSYSRLLGSEQWDLQLVQERPEMLRQVKSLKHLISTVWPHVNRHNTPQHDSTAFTQGRWGWGRTEGQLHRVLFLKINYPQTSSVSTPSATPSTALALCLGWVGRCCTPAVPCWCPAWLCWSALEWPDRYIWDKVFSV